MDEPSSPRSLREFALKQRALLLEDALSQLDDILEIETDYLHRLQTNSCFSSSSRRLYQFIIRVH